MLKMKRFAAQDQKVKQDDGEGLEPEGNQVPLADLGQKEHPVNVDQSDLKDQWV